MEAINSEKSWEGIKDQDSNCATVTFIHTTLHFMDIQQLEKESLVAYVN